LITNANEIIKNQNISNYKIEIDVEDSILKSCVSMINNNLEVIYKQESKQDSNLNKQMNNKQNLKLNINSLTISIFFEIIKLYNSILIK